jgi:hypothetical protein
LETPKIAHSSEKVEHDVKFMVLVIKVVVVSCSVSNSALISTALLLRQMRNIWLKRNTRTLESKSGTGATTARGVRLLGLGYVYGG